jgi:hypothetical protein
VRRLAALGAVLAALVVAAPAVAAPCIPATNDPNPPDAAALHAFGLLRRAATPADSWPAPDLLPQGYGFNESSFRRAGSLGGYRFFLLPGHRGCGGRTLLFVGAAGANSTVNGGVSLSLVRHFGFWFGQGFSGGSVVSGLVPDGVAKVRVTFPKGQNHPGGVDYPRAVTRTVRVHHNMALFKLGRTPADATPSRQVWFSKSGRVIRRAPGNP